MSIEVSENSGAKERFRLVGTEPPDGITMMPSGMEEFQDEKYIIYPDHTQTVRKLLEQHGVDYTSIPAEDEASTLVLRSEELVIPTLYIAYRFVKDHWDQIEYALEKIGEFYRDHYEQEVQMAVEVETENGNTTRIEYRGPPDEVDSVLPEIDDIVGVDENE